MPAAIQEFLTWIQPKKQDTSESPHTARDVSEPKPSALIIELKPQTPQPQPLSGCSIRETLPDEDCAWMARFEKLETAFRARYFK